MGQGGKVIASRASILAGVTKLLPPFLLFFFFLKVFFKIYLFIFGHAGSSLLRTGFL